MNLKLSLVYVLNLIFANTIVLYAFDLGLLQVVLITILVILATFIGIFIHQKIIKKLFKLLVDISISFLTVLLFLIINFYILGVHNNEDVSLWGGFLMELIIVPIGLMYSILAWLPSGIVNYFLLNFFIKNKTEKENADDPTY